MEKMRFAVLMCAEDSEYVKQVYGGYSGVFVKMLAEEGETWDVYKVARGEFPEDDDLVLYDGFVITGSCSDAHGNDKWVRDLLDLLNKLHSMNKKLLGICFGHQVHSSSSNLTPKNINYFFLFFLEKRLMISKIGAWIMTRMNVWSLIGSNSWIFLKTLSWFFEMCEHCAGASGPLSKINGSIKTQEFKHVGFAQFSVSLTLWHLSLDISYYAPDSKIRLINFP